MKKLKSQALVTRAWYPWLVWGLAASAFLIEYFARVSPGVMVDQLMQAFQVQALALGSFSAFFYYAYVGMQLPVGLLVDQFSSGRLLASMVLVCALGSAFFAFSTSVTMAAVARLIMGFGAAFAFVSALKLAAQWFPTQQFGFLAGLTQALGMLGAAAAQAPLAILVQSMGWRPTMLLLAGAMGLLAVVMYIIVRDKPLSEKNAYPVTPALLRMKASLKRVLQNPQNRWNALFAGLLYAPTAALAELWGVKFYRQVYGFSNEMAALAISMIFVGWTIGGPLVGWLSDHFKRRRVILQLSAALSLITMLVALFVPSLPWPGLLSILLIYGLVNTGVATSYTVAAESNAAAISGTAVAFTNMASVLVGAAFQPLIGGILDATWHHRLEGGIPVYTPQAFKTAMMVLPICLLLAWIVSFRVKESYGHHTQV